MARGEIQEMTAIWIYDEATDIPKEFTTLSSHVQKKKDYSIPKEFTTLSSHVQKKKDYSIPKEFTTLSSHVQKKKDYSITPGGVALHSTDKGGYEAGVHTVYAGMQKHKTYFDDNPSKRIISVEGVDGAGKTTLCKQLHSHLHGRGASVFSDFYAQPKKKEKFTSLLAERNFNLAMSVLEVARLKTVEHIDLALSRGYWVVLDR